MNKITSDISVYKLIDAVGYTHVWKPGVHQYVKPEFDSRERYVLDLSHLTRQQDVDFAERCIELFRPLLRDFSHIGIAARLPDNIRPAEPGDCPPRLLQIVTAGRYAGGEVAAHIFSKAVKATLQEKEAMPRGYTATMFGNAAIDIVAAQNEKPKSLRVFLGVCRSAIDQAADFPGDYPQGACAALLEPCSHVFLTTSPVTIPKSWFRKVGRQSGHAAIIHTSSADGQVMAWHDQLWRSHSRALLTTDAETDPRVSRPDRKSWKGAKFGYVPGLTSEAWGEE